LRMFEEKSAKEDVSILKEEVANERMENIK
jgi:hypothetical protein